LDDSRSSRGNGIEKSGQLLRFPHIATPDGALVVDSGDAHGNPDGARLESAGGDVSSADLFAILWRGLADILGTAAAATVLRRAAQRALPRWPELATLCIVREQLEYQYRLPASWAHPSTQPLGALSEVLRELWPLLVDLTGSVIIQRLAQIPELRERGILPPEEAPR
jgi:hypothetical protein